MSFIPSGPKGQRLLGQPSQLNTQHPMGCWPGRSSRCGLLLATLLTSGVHWSCSAPDFQTSDRFLFSFQAPVVFPWTSIPPTPPWFSWRAVRGPTVARSPSLTLLTSSVLTRWPRFCAGKDSLAMPATGRWSGGEVGGSTSASRTGASDAKAGASRVCWVAMRTLGG